MKGTYAGHMQDFMVLSCFNYPAKRRVFLQIFASSNSGRWGIRYPGLTICFSLLDYDVDQYQVKQHPT